MKRKCLAVGIILLFIGTSIMPSTAQDVENPIPTSRGNWLYVGGSGPGNYTMIQSAIDNASTGDTVFVYSGTYYENVVVNKIIDLIGEYKNTTIIDGGGSGSVIFVSSDEVNISGFTVQNSSPSWFDSGIKLDYSNDNTIMDNIISNNNVGIVLSFSSNNIVTGNIASNNVYGIYLVTSSNNNIMGNNVTSNNYYGIWLDNSGNNIIMCNNALNNNRGIYLISSSNNKITGNNANLNNWDGINLFHSSINKITGNNASNNGYGISLYSSSNNIIIGNDANLNNWGI
jgi:parallel beta-helix repeat protein